MSRAEVRVGGLGGTWLSSLSDSPVWGDLTVEHRWPLGCWEATWSMTTTSRKRPPALTANARTEVFLGSHCIWSGQLTEPDWAGGRFVAQGYCRQGESVPCMTAFGMTTSVPDVAIDNAISARWVDWLRTASISSTAYAVTDTGVTTDATDDLNSLAALLDAYTGDNQLRWGVDPMRRVYAAPDPTTPTWDVSPDTDPMGVSAEVLASTIAARYITNAVGDLATMVVGVGGPVVMVDLTSRGQITAAKAQTICQNILAQTAATTGWTNGITVSRAQVMRGGIHPHLGLVTAGQMVRLLGQRDPRGLDANTNVVVGASLWDATADTVALSPVDLVDRDLSTIIAKAGGALVS